MSAINSMPAQASIRASTHPGSIWSGQTQRKAQIVMAVSNTSSVRQRCQRPGREEGMAGRNLGHTMASDSGMTCRQGPISDLRCSSGRPQ